MFGHQFYPTPKNIVLKMIDGLKLYGKSVLDPSAGDGAILDVVAELTTTRWSHNRAGASLSAIEIDPALRAILLDKGYRVLDSDFLRFNGLYHFDFIFANPPFDNGVEHLLKIWEIANGATIRCLLNAESIRNLYTADRQRLNKIISDFGEVEILGPVFKDSRNPTSVDVALVKLVDTRQQESFQVDFDYKKAKNDFEAIDFENIQLAPADAFYSHEATFNHVIATFKALLQTRQELLHYMREVCKKSDPNDLILEALNKNGAELAYTTFLDIVTKDAWDLIFSKTKLSSITTQKVREGLEKQQAQTGQMAFTAENMKALFEALFFDQENIMTNCVLDAFDLITKYYHGNRELVDGWKTNSAYFVPKKFILGSVGDAYGLTGLDYRKARDIEDIEKACCFLSGLHFEQITSVAELYRGSSNFGERVFSTFFETQLYKKRSMHFWWLDDDLRKRFNALVAKERFGWLPEQIKVGVYG